MPEHMPFPFDNQIDTMEITPEDRERFGEICETLDRFIDVCVPEQY